MELWLFVVAMDSRVTTGRWWRAYFRFGRKSWRSTRVVIATPLHRGPPLQYSLTEQVSPFKKTTGTSTIAVCQFIMKLNKKQTSAQPRNRLSMGTDFFKIIRVFTTVQRYLWRVQTSRQSMCPSQYMFKKSAPAVVDRTVLIHSKRRAGRISWNCEVFVFVQLQPVWSLWTNLPFANVSEISSCWWAQNKRIVRLQSTTHLTCNRP